MLLVCADLPDGVSVGSGTLVGPRLVLTAAHVVFDDDGMPLPGVRVGLPDADFARGNTVWPESYLEQAGSLDLDAALVEITDEQWEPPRLGPVRWGRLTGRAAGIRCEATGFPRVLRDPNGARDSDQVAATINPGSRRFSGRYDLNVTSSSPTPATSPRAPSPWSGTSGAGVFAAGRLIAVVIIDERSGYSGDRLSAVPVSRLADDPLFVGQVALGDGGLEGPWDVESIELVELLPPSTLRSAPRRGPGMFSYATLLRADQEVVPFHGRDTELEEFIEWCVDPNILVGVRMLVGPSGQGKTRLALQLAQNLLARVGVADSRWITGFLQPDPDPPTAAPDLSPLADCAGPLLIVIDYAESRIEQVRRLMPLLWDADNSAPARVLLLARTPGQWWAKLCRLCPGLAATPVKVLSTLDDTVESRRRAYDTALTRFALRLGDIDSAVDWQSVLTAATVPADLQTDRYGSPLTLQISALLALIRGTPTIASETPLTGSAIDVDAASRPLEEELLDHERRYWEISARAQGLTLQIDTLSDAVAAAALLGAENEAEALATLSRIPGLGGQTADQIRALSIWLQDLYQSSVGYYLGSLQPDRIAEHLVGGLALKNPEFLAHLIEDASEGQVGRALSFLARAKDHQPHIAQQLRDLLERDRPHLEPIVVALFAAKSRIPSRLLDVELELVHRLGEEPDSLYNLYLEAPVELL